MSAPQYRRDNRANETKACKFCGMPGLRWDEVAPNKHRLIEPNGGIHDCRQYHDAKSNGTAQPSSHGNNGNAPPRSLLRQLNQWVKRWGDMIPSDAMQELDELMDDNSGNRR